MSRVVPRVLLALAALSLVAAWYFDTKVRERERLVSALIRETLRDVAPRDTHAVVRALAESIYRRTNAVIRRDELAGFDILQSLSPLNMDAGTSLSHGAYGIAGHTTIGPCGTMSRTLLVSLWSLGLPARKLQMYDDRARFRHTMVEYLAEGRWRTISPSDSGFEWRNREGRVATVDEILGDSTIFAQILERYPAYPVRFTRQEGIRWDKLPAPIRGAIRGVIGRDRYAQARTPEIYDRPRELLRGTALAMAVVLASLALAAWLTRRRKPAGSAA